MSYFPNIIAKYFIIFLKISVDKLGFIRYYNISNRYYYCYGGKQMVKYSKQRELIRENLLSRYDHPTADDVYASVKLILPNISLGTVYRNLSFLVEQGEVLSLKLGDGKEHFDGHTEPHYHFICTECGKVEDIFMKELQINKIAQDHFDGIIKGHQTYYYGICPKCNNKD